MDSTGRIGRRNQQIMRNFIVALSGFIVRPQRPSGSLTVQRHGAHAENIIITFDTKDCDAHPVTHFLVPLEWFCRGYQDADAPC